jgi:hypothetical protein
MKAATPLLAVYAVLFIFSPESLAIGKGYPIAPKALPTNTPISGMIPKALPAIAPVSGIIPKASPSVTPVAAIAPKVSPSVTPISAITAKDRPHRGDPLIASGLSLALTGAGQWYDGEHEKALWLLAPTAAYPIAWLVDSLFDSSLYRVGTFAVLVAAKGYSVWDAYQTASGPSKNK